MYWKDELDCLYQKNSFSKSVWQHLTGNTVELLLRNNKRTTGTIIEVFEDKDGIKVHFRQKGNNFLILTKNDIKYIDPYLK